MSQLGDTLKGIVEISKGAVRVVDATRVRGPLIDRLLSTAVIHEKVEMRGMARWVIKMLAAPLGLHFNSNSPLETQDNFIGPSIKIEGMSYSIARAIFRLAVQHQVRALAMVHNQKESQSPGSKYMAILLAAAMQERFQGLLTFQETVENNPEAFLWSLSETLHEEIRIEMDKNLGSYFKKRNGLQAIRMIQEKEPRPDPTYLLRDEISEALSESTTNHDHPFVESFSALKTET